MGVLAWLRKLLEFDPSVYKPESDASAKSDSGTSMNEGDFHSGPGGYSPNTPYPDTFYGSGGSNGDSGQDEGDFNR